MDRVKKKFQIARYLKRIGWDAKKAVEKAIRAVDKHPTAQQIHDVREWYKEKKK